MSGPIATPDMLLLIALAALATYLTRIAGHLVISRLKTVPPRLEAALDAVPAAVLTALVAPAFFIGGADVKIAMAVALLVGLRYSALHLLIAGWITVMVIRTVFMG